jgi:hypothetical protein
VATALNEIDNIRRQMAQIRRELHEDIQGVVVSAEAATDWRAYVRSYPWLAVGLTFAVGYLIVPRKHHRAIIHEVQVPTATPRQVEKKEKRAGLFGLLFGMVAPIATRALQSYASQYVENWIAQQAAAGPMPFGFPGFPGGPAPGQGHGQAGRPSGPGGPGR